MDKFGKLGDADIERIMSNIENRDGNLLQPMGDKVYSNENTVDGAETDLNNIGDDAEMINKAKRDKCKKSCKSFCAFVFSHVGLAALVVAYSILGGFLFRHLEGQSEVIQRMLISRTRTYAVAKLWNITTDLNILYEPNWTIMADGIMKEFQEDLVTAIKERGWDGRDEGNQDVKWSFPGSLLYSITVLTTIGYGHIVPKTVMGRIATMLYALPGIPLTLLCLSTIGATMATCFRFLYMHLCLFLYNLCHSKTPVESDSHSDLSNRPAKSHKPKRVRVPLYVSLFVIAAYIAAGSAMFSLWEKDWDPLISAYFCFITLSTIGFGDYVFGIGKELDSNAKLVTSTLYLVMGLSIIAMCFNLMQEEVKEKFLSLGKTLGIIERKKRLNPSMAHAVSVSQQ